MYINASVMDGPHVTGIPGISRTVPIQSVLGLGKVPDPKEFGTLIF